ncbi:hypothetical protein [Helicobacter valdiviensis]|nr:hypothetical protein [Helicobacter valdiviensis]
MSLQGDVIAMAIQKEQSKLLRQPYRLTTQVVPLLAVKKWKTKLVLLLV